ncbi:hypothetical protein BSLG_002658 [Batrachochytrium salamandrivorans]|nr:hypothetical protein BSLG_002658 [Batrachochytrium salamandrivorans]
MNGIVYFVLLTISFICTCRSTYAHGLFLYPGAINSPGFFGATRGYDVIKTDVSSLRNPLPTPNLCRGAPPSTLVDVSLTNGVPFTITLAFSLDANHIGPCSVEVIDPKNPGAPPVTIASVNGPRGCAVAPISPFASLAGTTDSLCPGLVPPGVQDASKDMCMSEWTFTVANADKIKCTTCIMRWTWSGQHISITDPEEYENCIDVRLTNTRGDGNGGGASSSTSKTTQDQTVTRESSTSSNSLTTYTESTASDPTTTSDTQISPRPTQYTTRDDDPRTTYTNHPRTSKKSKPTKTSNPSTKTKSRKNRRKRKGNKGSKNNFAKNIHSSAISACSTPEATAEDGMDSTDSDNDESAMTTAAAVSTPTVQTTDKSSAPGWRECKKSNSSAGGFYYACASLTILAGYYACYVEDALREPRFESCAQGTYCSQVGNWIRCS